jgi:hypothetical protein
VVPSSIIIIIIIVVVVVIIIIIIPTITSPPQPTPALGLWSHQLDRRFVLRFVPPPGDMESRPLPLLCLLHPLGLSKQT